MVTWLKTLSNHTYSTTGMNQPQQSDHKGTCGTFPPIKRQKYSGKKTWQYGKRSKTSDE